MDFLPHQKERIDFIRTILPLLGGGFVLKGGTALSLYYGLERYSEGIDLDSTSGNMDFSKRLSSVISPQNIIVKKSTDTVFRAMVNYGAVSDQGDYPLKIEVSNRNKEKLQNGSLRYRRVAGVNVYTIEELVHMKLSAFLGRDKIRDFHDIGFLLKKYPRCFSIPMLNMIEDRIYYRGGDELDYLLLEENDRHHLGVLMGSDEILGLIKKLQIRSKSREIEP